MGYVNEVLIVGRLGANPELAYTKAGMAVARMSVATHQKFKKGNATITETEWHRVVVFGRRAELVAESLKKSGEVYVKGVKRTSQFQDANGQQRQRVEIIVLDIRWPGSEKIDMTAPQMAKQEKTSQPSTTQRVKAATEKAQVMSDMAAEEVLDDAQIERELADLRKQSPIQGLHQ